MKLGKTGINVYFLAALAFVFAIFGWSTLGLLLLGYVIMVEKDKWLTRQVLEAFIVQLIAAGIEVIIGAAKSVLATILGTNVYYTNYYYTEGLLYRICNGILTWGGFIIHAAIFVLLICGLLNVMKGKESNTPIFSTITNWALGIVKPKPVYQQPPMNNQGQYQGPYQGSNQGQSQEQFHNQRGSNSANPQQPVYHNPGQQPKPFGNVHQQGTSQVQNQSPEPQAPPAPPTPPVPPQNDNDTSPQ